MKKKSSRIAHTVYFVGIGGIGMSALARYFFALGNKNESNKNNTEQWLVAGSDAAQSDITRELSREGMRIHIGHAKKNIDSSVGLVIYNRAIPKDSPELAAAKDLGVPAVPYARVLGEITRGHKTIAVTGSHGKTTTTALASIILLKNHLDPTVLIGSKLKELGGKNMRIGKSSYLVLEADDFGAAFLDYTPYVAIVTNIDREHLDFYKNIGNIKKNFLRFLSNIHQGGTMILNRDDAALYSLRVKIAAIAKKRNAKAIWYSLKDAPARSIKKSLRIFGEHNVSNALAAYRLGQLLKISEKDILHALGSYHGAWRRMEYRGVLKGMKNKQVKIFDDYAHHPTEIKATLAGLREQFPRSPIICVFQPHQAKRLQVLFKEFTHAFKDADALILLPLYAVKGRDERAKYDSKKLAAAIAKLSSASKISYLADPKHIYAAVSDLVSGFPNPAPVVVMMGAGNIVDFTKLLC